MANIKTKRERIKFASDNVAGACPEVLNAVIEANDGDSTPYGNDQISTELQDKFSEIFEKEVIVFPTASGTAANALAFNQNQNVKNSSTLTLEEAYKILNLDIKKNITKDDVKNAYIKIQKKIHPRYFTRDHKVIDDCK